MRRWNGAAALAVGTLVAAAAGLTGSDSAAHAGRDARCAGLADLKLEDTNLLSAAVVPASEGLPAYCRVLGYVRPAINFEIRLPTADWNGKFYMAGCGGFCGRLDSDRPGFINAMNSGLARNYAVSTMDSGHWGTGATDGRWAYNNRRAEIDWAYRAVEETARVSKAVIEAYYGTPAAHAYFQGCSTGGRMANMVALRTPEAFDGIISGAPALDYTGLVATFFAAVGQANTDAAGNDIVIPAVVPAIQAAVYEACDGLDGLEDGLIADPRACAFDPEALRCNAGQTEGCLSTEQVATVRAWYAGARNSAGEQLYPGGIPPGSEPYWWLWLTGDGAGNGRLTPDFNAEFLRFMAFQEDPGEGYTAADFDLDTDPARLDFMAAIYNSDDPDLGAFAAAGGRMLMWHGWADAIVTPYKTVAYYEAVEGVLGDATGDTVRLFMVPGMDHCGLLPGPGIDQSGFDPLSALERWVEAGESPDSLLATKRDADGTVLWTRPLCPYPQVARYDGSGDPDDAASFACAAP